MLTLAVAVVVVVVPVCAVLGALSSAVPDARARSPLPRPISVMAWLATMVAAWGVGAVLIAFTTASVRGIDTGAWISWTGLSRDLLVIGRAAGIGALAGVLGRSVAGTVKAVRGASKARGRGAS